MQEITLNVVNGVPTTNSRAIAQHFSKYHKDVIRKIESLECSVDFTERNFAPSEYIDSTGRKCKEYVITRDGFTILAMGFTGKAAMAWKEKYIAAWNAMEQALLKGEDAPEVLQLTNQALYHYWLTVDAKGQVKQQIPLNTPADLQAPLCQYFPYVVLIKREPALEDLHQVQQTALQFASGISHTLGALIGIIATPLGTEAEINQYWAGNMRQTRQGHA